MKNKSWCVLRSSWKWQTSDRAQELRAQQGLGVGQRIMMSCSWGERFWCFKPFNFRFSCRKLECFRKISTEIYINLSCVKAPQVHMKTKTSFISTNFIIPEKTLIYMFNTYKSYVMHSAHNLMFPHFFFFFFAQEDVLPASPHINSY